MNSYSSPIIERTGPSPIVSRCPFRNAGSIYCSASVMRAAISERQHTSYCSTDNYDNCPVYLGKILRENRIDPQQ